MQLRCCLVAALLAAGGAQAQGAQPRSGYPVGWNGLAETPPLGWRSWNAWNTRVSQANMEQTIDALVAKVWTTDGKANTSLLEAGYLSAGIDEGWEGCGMGVNGTQHAAGGNPVINTQKFPDMAGLVKHGHDAGLKIGWYENGCACGEKKALMQNYEGDVRQLHAFGFDGVKLDGCGAQCNLTLYAQLMNRTGKSYLIENCHFGRCTDWDNSSCPTAAWCPFNWYRTSGDINSSPMSWLRNLQTTIAFQDPVAPLSRPHCWAYPDMLEVGNINVNGRMHYEWNRAHFGAWSVISSPLILGMDVTQTERVAAVIDVITNKHAIAVNQAWHGHPGGLVWSKGGLPPWTPGVHYPAARPCNLSNSNLKQAGWSIRPSSAEESIAPGVLQQAVVAPGGGCLEAKGSGYGGGRGGLVIAPCNGTNLAQAWTYDPATLQIKQFKNSSCVAIRSGGPITWLYECSASSASDTFSFNASTGTLEAAGDCLGVESYDPTGGAFPSTLQGWAKPLNASAAALLLINPDIAAHEFDVPVSSLPLPKESAAAQGLTVYDIWSHISAGTVGRAVAGANQTIKMTVGALDSAFLLLHLA